MRCVAHPGIVTTRSCALCGQPRCDGCLSPSPIGPVCPDCAEAAGRLPPPPPPPTAAERLRPAARFFKELVFWLLALSPLAVGVVHTLNSMALLDLIDWIHEEPLRLGQVVEELTALGAAAEAGQRAEGAGWDGEAWMEEVEASVDPYSLDAEPYQVRPDPTGMRLCSLGPDRVDDAGAPLDRFTGAGDVCIHLRSPAMLKVP